MQILKKKNNIAHDINYTMYGWLQRIRITNICMCKRTHFICRYIMIIISFSLNSILLFLSSTSSSSSFHFFFSVYFFCSISLPTYSFQDSFETISEKKKYPNTLCIYFSSFQKFHKLLFFFFAVSSNILHHIWKVFVLTDREKERIREKKLCIQKKKKSAERMYMVY